MKPTPETLPLRDIHLPEPVSWWPPAPGWWLLLLVAVLGALFIAWWVRRRTRTRLPRAARRELDAIRARHRADGDDRILVEELSILLRRVSLSSGEAARIAGLTGEAWLAWLDEGLDGEAFRTGAGRALVTAPYQADPQVDAAALLDLCERWLDRQRETAS